jgi:hypothetical protein
VSLKPPPLK